MKTLYESILDVDNNINRANTNAENMGKSRAIIHNFIDDLIDLHNPDGYTYLILKNYERKFSTYNELLIEMRINGINKYEYRFGDRSDYLWFKSIFDKHKKDLLSIHKLLGVKTPPHMYYSKRYDDIYIEQSIDKSEYRAYNFHIRKFQDNISIVLNDVYIDDIRKLINSKHIRNDVRI